MLELNVKLTIWSSSSHIKGHISIKFSYCRGPSCNPDSYLKFDIWEVYILGWPMLYALLKEDNMGGHCASVPKQNRSKFWDHHSNFWPAARLTRAVIQCGMSNDGSQVPLSPLPSCHPPSRTLTTHHPSSVFYIQFFHPPPLAPPPKSRKKYNARKNALCSGWSKDIPHAFILE